jgi:hypothetical protein
MTAAIFDRQAGYKKSPSVRVARDEKNASASCRNGFFTGMTEHPGQIDSRL